MRIALFTQNQPPRSRMSEPSLKAPITASFSSENASPSTSTRGVAFARACSRSRAIAAGGIAAVALLPPRLSASM